MLDDVFVSLSRRRGTTTSGRALTVNVALKIGRALATVCGSMAGRGDWSGGVDSRVWARVGL